MNLVPRFRVSRTYGTLTVEMVALRPVADRKGRIINFRVGRSTLDIARDDSGFSTATEANLGHWFTARVQQCRNGSSFGSLQPERRFRTEAEREAWIAETLEQRTQSAEKKWSIR